MEHVPPITVTVVWHRQVAIAAMSCCLFTDVLLLFLCATSSCCHLPCRLMVSLQMLGECTKRSLKTPPQLMNEMRR